jgi:hypothetical protein
MDANSVRNMQSVIAVTNKHTAKLHHVGSLHIFIQTVKMTTCFHHALGHHHVTQNTLADNFTLELHLICLLDLKDPNLEHHGFNEPSLGAQPFRKYVYRTIW